MQGWGAMNPTAVKEAAKINFPMDHLIGIWWAGDEDDARPAGDGGKGYQSLDFNQVGQNFPVIQDILKHVVDKGKSQVAAKDKVGEILYNRGVSTRCSSPRRSATRRRSPARRSSPARTCGAASRSLNITEARLKELGMDGFAAPFKRLLQRPQRPPQRLHGRSGTARSGSRRPTGSSRSRTRCVPLIDAAAKDYADVERRLAEAHRGLRQGVVSR